MCSAKIFWLTFGTLSSSPLRDNDYSSLILVYDLLGLLSSTKHGVGIFVV